MAETSVWSLFSQKRVAYSRVSIWSLFSQKGSRTITYLVWIWVRVLVEVVHDSDGADVDEAHPARLVEGALRCRRVGTVYHRRGDGEGVQRSDIDPLLVVAVTLIPVAPAVDEATIAT